MQITKRLVGNMVELRVEGRLDVYWADHLAAAVDQEIRQGSHHIRLDLSPVAFMSSAGIGVLVRFYRELNSIQGSFAISKCSRGVRKILEISKLDVLLVTKPEVESSLSDDAGQSSTLPALSPVTIKQTERSGVIYEVHPLAAESTLECRAFGNASLFERAAFAKEHCRAMQFSDSTFAIGLGALGENFEDCRGRFGEFIAAGGAVAYLPTDGTNVPDFLLGGRTTPEVQVCYGIACDGRRPHPFSSLIRFEAKKNGAPVALTLLLESCLELAGSEQVGILAIAESAGLVGAALRRSPLLADFEPEAFELPRIRDWLTFTAERAYTKSVVLLAGIAVRGGANTLAHVTRPFPNPASSAPTVFGHFHAAAFGYRPVQKGQIDLNASIKTLFEGQALEGVLHLLHDDRAISAAGQSEFIRGACWIAPISKISVEGAPA
jgi:anti-anti-sigma factor